MKNPKGIIASFSLMGFTFLNLNCITGGLVLRPRDKEKSQCSASPRLSLYKIKNIAVFPFETSPRTEKGDYVPPYAKRKHKPIPMYIHLEDDGNVVATSFEKQLIRTYRYKVVDRRKINRIVKEIELRQTGLIDEKNLVKIGKLTGADAVITGKINIAAAALQWQSYGDIVYAAYIGYVNLQLRMTDVETGEVVWVCDVKRNSLNYINDPITISSSNDIPKLAIFGGPADKDLIMFVLDKAFSEAIKEIQ